MDEPLTKVLGGRTGKVLAAGLKMETTGELLRHYPRRYLEPTELSATALLDYAVLYAASEDGAVPYKQWPPALKGHFLCRFPCAAELQPADSDLPPETTEP